MNDAKQILKIVPYDREFLADSLVWFRNDELRNLTCTPIVTREIQERFYASLSNRKDYMIWGLMLAHERIGACGLKHITGLDAEYWGYIGIPDLWGRGLGESIVNTCLVQARNVGLRRVYLKVIPENIRAVRLYSRMGFVDVGLTEDGLSKMSIEL